MESVIDNSYLHVLGEWHKLWQLKISYKVNNVLRASREILPIRDTLRSRGLEVPLSCIHCPNEFKNSWHLFIRCNYAQCCWQYVGLDAEVYRLTNDAGFFVE